MIRFSWTEDADSTGRAASAVEASCEEDRGQDCAQVGVEAGLGSSGFLHYADNPASVSKYAVARPTRVPFSS